MSAYCPSNPDHHGFTLYSMRMNTLCPFSGAMRQCNYLLVAVRHFTKLLEDEAVTSITVAEVHHFIWKTIMTRLRIPYVMVFESEC